MNIVILSYRVSGNDGVSLECAHWKTILTRMGHKVTFLAGQLDRAGVLMPQLHFQSPEVMEIHDSVVYGKGRYGTVEAKVFDIAGTIEGGLRQFFNRRRKVDLLIVPNVFSLPMHFPLAVALTRILEEYKIPTIARHHDFWWERKRYLKSGLFGFFEHWFPPKVYLIKHVVINSLAQKELKKRTGLESAVISDSFDFSNTKIIKRDAYAKSFRRDFDIAKDDIVFLQATRIIPRKRIELAINLVAKLNDPRVILVLCGHTGDEGLEYFDKIIKLCETSHIRYKFVGDFVSTKRRLIDSPGSMPSKRRRVYTLWDVYVNSDIVLYPVHLEGFGNQFVEAVFFRKPVIITPYKVFKSDIDPLGFKTIKITKNISDKSIARIKKLIASKKQQLAMVEKNFELGKKYFSYEATAEKINKLLSN